MGPVAAIVGVVAGVASAVAGVVGGIKQAESQQRQAAAAKSQGEAQARAAEENARQVQIAAQIEKDQQRRRMARITSSQRAKIGASGVTMEGTPLEILEDTAYEGELENLRTDYQANQQASRLYGEAGNYRAAGDSLAESYSSQAGTSLLTGVTTGVARGIGAFDSYRSWQNKRRPV
jgi:hypothetical protein